MVHGLTAVVSLVWVVLASMVMIVEAEAVRGGSAKASAMKNPVRATAASITKGRQLYGMACRHCHGLRGKGDGPLATKNPSPADLTDAAWDFGASDGEIFTVISEGVAGDSLMKGFRSSLTPSDMWSVVNFIRTLPAATP